MDGYFFFVFSPHSLPFGEYLCKLPNLGTQEKKGGGGKGEKGKQVEKEGGIYKKQHKRIKEEKGKRKKEKGKRKKEKGK